MITYQWRDKFGGIHDATVTGTGQAIFSLVLFLERQARGMVVGDMTIDVECSIEGLDELMYRRLYALGVRLPDPIPLQRSRNHFTQFKPRSHRLQVIYKENPHVLLFPR